MGSFYVQKAKALQASCTAAQGWHGLRNSQTVRLALPVPQQSTRMCMNSVFQVDGAETKKVHEERDGKYEVQKN